MDIDEQLGRLRPTIEVETFVRSVASRRMVEAARRGDQLTLSRRGAPGPAVTCHPAAVSIAVDPAQGRALEGTSLVERVETKTVTTSHVWITSARLGTELEAAVDLALAAVDRSGRPAATTPTRVRTRRAPAAAPPPERPICPGCGTQFSAAGTCFCD